MLIKASFCASKDQYYYGVKLHVVVTGKNAAPYTFLFSVVSPASINDLRILEENISETKAPVIMGDKASISKKLQKQAKLQGKEMITPKKKPRGGKLSHVKQENFQNTSGY